MSGDGRLAGKTVLITGAGSGLGRESALLFAAEGANVVVTDLLPARAAVPVMKQQGRGTILAVSSMAGFVAYPGFPGYAAAKHGVNGLVKGMSLSLGGYGIRANALCPAHGMSINFAMPPDADVL